MPFKETTKMDQRTAFALRAIQSDVNMTQLCIEYGISKPTGYKWKERFLGSGHAGLHDASKAPKHSPTQLSEDQSCDLIRIKLAHRSWGPNKIRAIYARSHEGDAPSLSSVKRVLKKAGLTQIRRRRSRSSAGRIHSSKVAQRCNEVWTIDFKGWWRCRDHQRCEPLTVRDEKSCHVLAARALESTRTEDVKACFTQLFEAYGLPDAIRSDNGSPFACTQSLWGLTKLSAWFMSLGITLERGRPGHPQDNGAHERMHKDIAEEVEAHAQGNLREQQAALDLWREEFNTVRPHEKIGMKTPSEVYEKSPRAFKKEPVELMYPQMLTRKVNQIGKISIGAKTYWLTTALAGWHVGINPLKNGRKAVYFAGLLLGEIEEKTESFHRADIGTVEQKDRQSA